MSGGDYIWWWPYRGKDRRCRGRDRKVRGQAIAAPGTSVAKKTSRAWILRSRSSAGWISPSMWHPARPWGGLCLFQRLLRGETCGGGAHPVCGPRICRQGHGGDQRRAPGAIATPMPQRNPAEITEPIRTSIPMQRSGRWMKSRRRVPERNMTAIRRCIESIAPDVGPVGLVECYNKVKGAASDSDAAPSRLFESGTVIRLLQLR